MVETYDPNAISPKVRERLMRAIDNPEDYDEHGKHIGNALLRGKIAWDPTRGMTMILPEKEWRLEVPSVEQGPEPEATD